jgi:hypothetical protein
MWPPTEPCTCTGPAFVPCLTRWQPKTKLPAVVFWGMNSLSVRPYASPATAAAASTAAPMQEPSACGRNSTSWARWRASLPWWAVGLVQQWDEGCEGPHTDGARVRQLIRSAKDRLGCGRLTGSQREDQILSFAGVNSMHRRPWWLEMNTFRTLVPCTCQVRRSLKPRTTRQRTPPRAAPHRPPARGPTKGLPHVLVQEDPPVVVLEEYAPVNGHHDAARGVKPALTSRWAVHFP